MEKKFKFSDNPDLTKTVYGIVIAALCIAAIVIGIVAANNQKDDTLMQEPPTQNEEQPPIDSPNGTENEEKPEEPKKPQKNSFLSPVSGTVTKAHSLSVPVFSSTLEEWRIHTGIDIGTEDGASVFAAFDGEVCAVTSDALLGCTVVVDHGSGVKSYYSNLEDNDLIARVGTLLKAGDLIGEVGDSSISELAEEPHLHFEVKVSDVSVDPLEYISTESKRASLGIDEAA
ncbi:MAG: M23 family metallopeptidase [Clostridia bacterium]|nr:M23 family metallopeptidase [Clostridia bacterium]